MLVKKVLPIAYFGLGIFLYSFGRFVGLILKLLTRKREKSEFTIALEAGKLGWKSVVFQELLESSYDYFGEHKVQKIVIDREARYIQQVLRQIKSSNFTYYFFDPRTTSTNFIRCSLQIFALTVILGVKNAKPLVMVTDYSVRMWRLGALTISARRGHVFNFLDSTHMKEHFFHSRLLNLQIFPMSRKTLRNIEKFGNRPIASVPISIGFVGALYSLRQTFFTRIREEIAAAKSLQERCNLQVVDKNYSNDTQEYFKNLAVYDAIITTTLQERCYDYVQDRLDIPQMVFRITETLALNKLLICTPVPGMEKYLLPDVDYILISEISDIVKLNQSVADLEWIRRSGHERIKWHIENQTFWKQLIK